jgi:DDE superfamily endonuclease/Helix-turn-helix of DDE superfamily endonuclease
MPSYHDAKPNAVPERQWQKFTAAVAVSTSTRDKLAERIAEHRAKIGTRWRLLDPTTQATLVIAYLRTNLTYAELAAGNNISTATCWRYIDEGIGLLAGAAIRLKDVVRLARKAGWDYLLVDGVNVPTVAFGRKLNRRQKHYSGKHKRHGVNVQTICAPDGRLLWASAALPGRTTDITAARRHKLDKKVGKLIGLLADLGYLGLADVLTAYRRKRGQKELPAATRAANKVHASLRCVGERGNAQLKWWRVLATELRCRPARCTRIVKAVLALHHLETAPFAA